MLGRYLNEVLAGFIGPATDQTVEGGHLVPGDFKTHVQDAQAEAPRCVRVLSVHRIDQGHDETQNLIQGGKTIGRPLARRCLCLRTFG